MTSSRAKLIENLHSLSNEHGILSNDQLLNNIRRQWSVHDDMFLFPSSHCFVDSRWRNSIH